MPAPTAAPFDSPQLWERRKPARRKKSVDPLERRIFEMAALRASWVSKID